MVIVDGGGEFNDVTQTELDDVADHGLDLVNSELPVVPLTLAAAILGEERLSRSDVDRLETFALTRLCLDLFELDHCLLQALDLLLYPGLARQQVLILLLPGDPIQREYVPQLDRQLRMAQKEHDSDELVGPGLAKRNWL